MLVVSEVLPGSAADGKLQVGDILVRINGEYLTDFAPLEAILDDRVGQPVELTVERGGLQLSSPSRCRISINSARTSTCSLAMRSSTTCPISRRATSTGRPKACTWRTPASCLRQPESLAAASSWALRASPCGSWTTWSACWPARRISSGSPCASLRSRSRASSKVRVVRMDRRWFPAVRCRRDDRLGEWPCRSLDPGPAPRPPEGGEARFVDQPDARLRKIAPSLVLVNFDMPYTVSGVSEQHYYGTGLVVDAERGYVVVDRNTIPEAIGDVRMTFGGSLEIPGPRGLRPPAAQPGARCLRSRAHRRHAGDRRALCHAPAQSR